MHISLQPSRCSSPCPTLCVQRRGDGWSCAGTHGVWSTGRRLLMCSRVRACLPGRPCPPCPAPHVGKGRGMLGSAPGVFKEMLRGCSGDTQGMPRGMPRRVWSIQQSSAAQGSLAWRPLAATGPQAFASSEEGTGWQRGSLLPPGTPRAAAGALRCTAAAPAPLSPGGMAQGMLTFTLLLLQARLRGRRAG